MRCTRKCTTECACTKLSSVPDAEEGNVERNKKGEREREGGGVGKHLQLGRADDVPTHADLSLLHTVAHTGAQRLHQKERERETEAQEELIKDGGSEAENR